MTVYQAKMLWSLVMDRDDSTSTLRYMMYVLDESLLPSRAPEKNPQEAAAKFLREWADALSNHPDNSNKA